MCGKVFAVSDAVAISKPEYSSLVQSSRTIMKIVEKKCGITSQMLFGAPRFGHVLEELLDWISTTVKEVEEYHNIPHYPVLVAHNGFTFDFRILLAELHRRINRLKSIKLHFADPYFDCKREVKSNNPLFSSWTAVEKRRLGIGIVGRHSKKLVTIVQFVIKAQNLVYVLNKLTFYHRKTRRYVS